jgi:formylglycine-generating enzyme required for sulfatase activity
MMLSGVFWVALVGADLGAVLSAVFDSVAREWSSRHQVTISNAFYMQTTEVTQGQWIALMRHPRIPGHSINGGNLEPWKGLKHVKEGANYPAVNVSWNAAVEFCEELSKREGRTYRLPTEAEWEYACRAGTKTTWSFGDDEKELGDYAWCQQNSWNIDEKWNYVHQVGRKIPNAFGLYDMHGNVQEWCHDYYEKDYYKQSPEKDPMGPAYGGGRVCRGGSCIHDTVWTRSYFRSEGTPHRDHPIFWTYTGFRLVLELD